MGGTAGRRCTRSRACTWHVCLCLAPVQCKPGACVLSPLVLQPTFAVTTATLANPAEHARELLGVQHVEGALPCRGGSG